MLKLMRVVSVFTLLCALAFPSLAQTEPSNFVQVLTTTIKPGAVTEYESYVQKILAGAGKIGAPQRVVCYQVVIGPASTYNFVFPFNKWEDMDSWVQVPQILTRAYGDAEAARILKAGRDSIEHSETAVYRILKNLSTRPRFNDPPSPYVMLVRTEIEPGMAASYERFLAKLKAAQEQEPNARSINRAVSVLGPAATYLGANFFSKHAERDGWTTPQDLLRKTYGDADGQELLESSLRAVRKREIWVQAYRADLSRLAPMTRR